MSTQEPAQSARPAGQFPVHFEPVHTSFEAQTVPQPPQFAGSDVVSTQFSPHRVRPASHAHVPAVHALEAPQPVPQLPQ